MTRVDDWKTTFEAEIQQAEKARRLGNEGMARVCARRAAGALAGEYLERHGERVSGRLGETQSERQEPDRGSYSAYDRLRCLCEQPGVSSQAVQTAQLFLIRVTVEHTLPVDADLIAEARWLRQELLGE